MEEMRKQFEVWFKYKYHLAEEHLSLGEYGSETAQIAWQAWQASRAALVVELPVIFGAGRTLNALRVAIKDCAETLKEAGITVKGEGSEQEEINNN